MVTLVVTLGHAAVAYSALMRESRIAYRPAVWRLLKQGTKLSYPWFTRRLAGQGVLLMNFGYESDPPLGISLSADDEPNRYPIQLYHFTAGQTDLTGKRVLEVGCGHGGGASYLTRTFDPVSYTGLDRNLSGIEFCERTHQVPGLTFTQGDAQELPFPDESFDAVVNVESSHCYTYPDRFLAEVARVLTPGGAFLYTDAWPQESFAEWDAYLDNAPLDVAAKHDVSRAVMAGMLAQADKFRSTGEGQLALRLLFGLKRNQDMSQSKFYRELEDGTFSYRVFLLRKPS